MSSSATLQCSVCQLSWSKFANASKHSIYQTIFSPLTPLQSGPMYYWHYTGLSIFASICKRIYQKNTLTLCLLYGQHITHTERATLKRFSNNTKYFQSFVSPVKLHATLKNYNGQFKVPVILMYSHVTKQFNYTCYCILSQAYCLCSSGCQ